MFINHFGIEMEFTGITREQAAEVAAKFLGGTATHAGGYYGTYHVTAPDGRIWKFMSDASIDCQRKKRTPYRSRRHKLQCRAGQPHSPVPGRHRHRTGSGTAFTQGRRFHQ